jgi:type VI secretion system secreted protein Hcp
MLGSRRRMVQIALPTVVALGVGAAVAAGSIPGSDGTITACYANKTDENGNPQIVVIDNIPEPPGALRVIDPGKATPAGAAPNPASSCVPGESMITWNQAGPQGPPGPPGSPGTAGIQGAQGAQGAPLVGETTLGFSPRDGKILLEIEGIEGESQDDGHKGPIEIESFSLSGGGGGSQGKGKVALSSFHITKKIDKSSPLLLKAAVTGKPIPNAELSFTRKVGGKGETYLDFDFHNVRVSSVQDGTSAGQVPTEALSLSYQKLEMTYYDAQGKPGQSVSVNVGSTLKP